MNTINNSNTRPTYVVVISLDAVSKEDFDFLSTLPNLCELKNKGAFSSNVSTVLPAQTYTVHASIVTGMHPQNHGITNNHPLQPGVPNKNQRWYSCSSEIKAPLIYEAAKAKGLKTASFLWPLTEKSNINYNLPEIAPMPGENQILRIALGGSTLYLLSSILKFKDKISTTQPGADIFNTIYATYAIKKKKPNLTLIHLVNVDSTKHVTGMDSIKIKEGLITMDNQVGEIINATKEAGIFNETAFLIISDHGQIEIKSNVRVNNAFVRSGLITVNENNEITSWKAISQTTGNGSLITVKHNNDIEKTKEVLQQLSKNSKYGIKMVLDRTEIERLGGGKEFEFILQGNLGIHFSDEIVNPFEFNDFYEQKTPYATHGYTPLVEDELGINPILIASGCGIKNVGELSKVSVLDYAPTIAKLLNLDNFDVDKCDGTPLYDMLICE